MTKIKKFPTVIEFDDTYKFDEVKKFFYRLKHNKIIHALDAHSTSSLYKNKPSYKYKPSWNVASSMYSRRQHTKDKWFVTFDYNTVCFIEKSNFSNAADEQIRARYDILDFKSYSFLVQEYRECLIHSPKIDPFTGAMTNQDFSLLQEKCDRDNIPLFLTNYHTEILVAHEKSSLWALVECKGTIIYATFLLKAHIETEQQLNIADIYDKIH